MRKPALPSLLSLVLGSAAAYATIFSQVHGVVHDPQHRPIANARVELHAANSAFTQTTITAHDGSFTIPNLPLADYTLTTSQPCFPQSPHPSPPPSPPSPIPPLH